MEAGEREGRGEKGEEEATSSGRNLRSGVPSRCHILFVRSTSLGPAPTEGVETSGSGALREPFSKVACPCCNKGCRNKTPPAQAQHQEGNEMGRRRRVPGRRLSEPAAETHQQRTGVGSWCKKGPVCEYPGSPRQELCMLEKAQGPVTQRASVTEHCLVREELRPYNRSHDANIPRL